MTFTIESMASPLLAASRMCCGIWKNDYLLCMVFRAVRYSKRVVVRRFIFIYPVRNIVWILIFQVTSKLMSVTVVCVDGRSPTLGSALS